MTARKPPRYQGKITTWKGDQGFGFVTPNGGGPLVFVHIKSFTSRRSRPAINDVVTYDLTVNEKGQPRADNIDFVRDRGSRHPAHHGGVISLVGAVGFLGILAVLVLIGRLPSVVFGVYVGISVLTFIAYAVDKSAARNNQWRTKESTLHMLGLVGGWPGALVAQQVVRHKLNKPTFQTMFWSTVAVNCASLGWFLSSSGASALRSILA